MRQEGYLDIINKINVKREALGIVVREKNFCHQEILYQQNVRQEKRELWKLNGYDIE